MNANEERIMRDASKTAKSLGISVEEVLNFATIIISGMPEASADMFSTCSRQIVDILPRLKSGDSYR